MENPTTQTIGIDLGDLKSHVCILGSDGGVLQRTQVPTKRPNFEAFFKDQPRSRVIVEVGTCSRWVSKIAKDAGHEIIVANSRRLALITQNDRKRDKKDAELLAQVGRTNPDLLSPVTHRSDEAHRDLQVLRSRDGLVGARTKLINTVRGMGKTLGYRFPKVDADYFFKLRERVPDEMQAAFEPLFAAIEAITAQVKATESTLAVLANTKYAEEFSRVSQPSGVALITALAFILTLEKPERFKNSRNVPAYIGLVPRSDQSGKVDKQLGITKAGDPLLRRLLVQCAAQMLRRNSRESDLREWGLRLAERGGKNGKKRATIAVARKLAVLMHRLWTTGEDYQPVGYAKAA